MSEKKRRSRRIQYDWKHEHVTKLIDAVEAEPVLWSASVHEYRNKKTRDAAWKRMSENVFDNEIDPGDLNLKWQSLRCQFKDYSNKQMRKKSNENYVVRWRYFDQLKFLIPNDGNEANDGYESSSNLSVMSVEDESNTDTAIGSTPRSRATTHTNNIIPVSTITSDTILEKALNTLDKYKDDAQIFGDFIASAIRELPAKEQQQELKRVLNRSLLSFQDAQIPLIQNSINNVTAPGASQRDTDDTQEMIMVFKSE